MEYVFNGLIVAATGVGLLFVSRLISRRYERRLRGYEALFVSVVNKETVWTDGGGRHIIYVGTPQGDVEQAGKASGGIEVDRKTFESTRRGDEVRVFRHPRTGELRHLSADHEFAFLILIFGWLVTGVGVVLAAVNLIRLLAE